MTHRGTVELHTPRLRLRRYDMADVEAMFRNFASDERVTRFLSWPPYKNAEDVKPFLAARVAEYVRDDVYAWAMEFEGEMTGSISVVSLDETNQVCEIGYCLGYAYWNKGLATEALRAVTAFLFDEVNTHRVMAKHDAENPASGAVMKKCGMAHEGTLRGQHRRRDGTYADSLVYGILKEEFDCFRRAELAQA
ncbi:MAG: GNAT family N-acetyltransferase [Oscillospiraceae bacterium]|nr:GNAT family N-acetyltransferase [Oscillospiraceae bacterium]